MCNTIYIVNLDIFKGVLQIIPGLITFAYVVSIIAIIVVSFVIVILRFYRNLMTDEGYLMFTLPVKPHQLIASKMYASVLWTVACIVAVLASIFAVIANDKNLRAIQAGFQALSMEMHNDLGNYTGLFIAEIIILIIVSFFNSVLQIYASIAIGQLFQGHKVLGSFAAYIGINVVLQVIVTIISAIAGFFMQDNFDDILILPQVVFPVMIIFVVILTGLYYWITNMIFNRKLNLD
jgi:hypothetical protein